MLIGLHISNHVGFKHVHVIMGGKPSCPGKPAILDKLVSCPNPDYWSTHRLHTAVEVATRPLRKCLLVLIKT